MFAAHTHDYSICPYKHGFIAPTLPTAGYSDVKSTASQPPKKRSWSHLRVRKVIPKKEIHPCAIQNTQPPHRGFWSLVTTVGKNGQIHRSLRLGDALGWRMDCKKSGFQPSGDFTWAPTPQQTVGGTAAKKRIWRSRCSGHYQAPPGGNWKWMANII